MPDAAMSSPRVQARTAPRAHGARPKASDEMLCLFIGFQKTRCGAAAAEAAEPARVLAQSCDRMLAAFRDEGLPNPVWADAYEVERSLLILESGRPLLESLKRLLDRADIEKVPNAADLRRAFEALLGAPREPAATPDDALLRPLALVVLEGVQWSEAERFKAIPLRHGAVHRIILGGVVAFALFAAPYVWVDVAVPLGHEPSLRAVSGLPLWTALTSGLLGAFFSRLLSVQTGFGSLSLNEIENIGAWDSILLRGGVGMLGSLIVCFFLQSNVVAGTLFPKFSEVLLQGPAAGGGLNMVPTPALATLVVWSFLAGFSERLVPSVLARTEARLDAAVEGKGPPKGVP